MLKSFLAGVSGALVPDLYLNNNSNGVFDWVEEGTPFPFITFGDMTTSNDDTKTIYGNFINLDILVWSKDPGRERTLELCERVEEILEDESFNIPGLEIISCEVDNITVMEQSYGTYCGIIKFSARVE